MSSEKKGSFEINICLGAPIEYAQRSKEFRKTEDEYSGKINRKEQDNQKHWFRTEFMRDRDKISFSQAFRRLSGKTQIFFAHYHDHARTRLTHTLEVAQLARTVAKSVNLDVDLAEAIMDGIGSKIVKKLFQAYISNPQQLPDMTIYSLYKKYDQPYIDEKWNKFKYCEQRDDEVFTRIASDLRENRLNIDRHNKNFIPFLFRTISDYISGMTDNYASKEYQELFGNSSLF